MRSISRNVPVMPTALSKDVNSGIDKRFNRYPKIQIITKDRTTFPTQRLFFFCNGAKKYPITSINTIQTVVAIPAREEGKTESKNL